MKKLRQEDMRMESASKSGAEIAGDTLRRMGKYVIPTSNSRNMANEKQTKKKK